jgi:hypothetical protein
MLKAQNYLLAHHGMSTYTSPVHQPATRSIIQHASQTHSPPGFGHAPTSGPLQHAFQTQHMSTPSIRGSSGQETLLPQAFSAITLQDPTIRAWNIYTSVMLKAQNDLLGHHGLSMMRGFATLQKVLPFKGS